MLMWLQANVVFNGSIYAGYSKTKRTSDLEVVFDGSKEVGLKSQNQGVGLLFLGASYLMNDFEFGLSGFVGSTLMKEDYFKNRFFGGVEASLLYHDGKFSFGFLGGLDVGSFKSFKYEYSDVKNEKNHLSNNDVKSMCVVRGFVGAKLAYAVTDCCNIGVKYHLVFPKEKSGEAEFFAEKETGGSITGLIGPAVPINTKIKTKFLTHRVLIGIELKTKGASL